MRSVRPTMTHQAGAVVRLVRIMAASEGHRVQAWTDEQIIEVVIEFMSSRGLTMRNQLPHDWCGSVVKLLAQKQDQEGGQPCMHV